MSGLCRYRHIFGVEKEGMHQYRLFDIAIADTLMTVAGAMIISYFTKYNVFLVFIVLIIIGTLLHRLFCVQTTITKVFFW